MKLLSLITGLSLFGASVLSHPLDLPFDFPNHDANTLEKRAGVLLTKGASGSVETRLEIRTMQSQQPNQFTLLMLAMQKWQATPQTQQTGYYQIAGIHGVPRANFNGVAECSSCKGADGYCTHNSVLFPGWHRAYMATFEQEFVVFAKQIANSWPESGASTTRAQMQAAAATIRFPYWDWAAKPPSGNNMPSCITTPQITINGPTGSETIANPLYQHHFVSESALVYSDFTHWPNTLRYPNTDAATAKSVEASAIKNFNSIRGSLQDQVYKLLTACDDYLHFSNDAASSSTAGCANSLEGIHDTVHSTAGGVPSSAVPTVGHMYYLSLAAFDPIFWLHHMNVDRLFALWQTLHSGSYGASQVAVSNTWTIAKGTTQSASSPLEPFYRSAGTFWTTNDVQDWTIFQYTYPEYANSDGSKASITAAVNALYGPNASATAGQTKRSIFDIPAGAIANNGSAYEYVANIQAPRFALNGTYYVFVFVGTPKSEDSSTWFSDPSLAGPYGVLSQPGMTNADVIVSGSIPLTRSLTDLLGSGAIKDLSEAVVGPYLATHLQWRILGPTGNTVDPTTLPNFLVSAVASTATIPTSDTVLPTYSKFVPFTVATHGKKGGQPAIGLGPITGTNSTMNGTIHMM